MTVPDLVRGVPVHHLGVGDDPGGRLGQLHRLAVVGREVGAVGALEEDALVVRHVAVDALDVAGKLWANKRSSEMHITVSSLVETDS